MATRYVQQASKQLHPAYATSINAQKAQLPAIQQLYSTLVSGLEGQRQTETQNILESASQRGVLRSTMPVDLQASLGAALLAERGKLGSQQAQEEAAVRGNIGQLRIQRAQGIQELAGALQQRSLQERQFQLQKKQAERELALKREEMMMQMAAARSSGGGGGRGGGGGSTSFANRLSGAASSLGGELRKVAGKDGYVSPQNYAAARREWGAAGFADFDKYFGGFKNPQNQNYKYF